MTLMFSTFTSSHRVKRYLVWIITEKGILNLCATEENFSICIPNSPFSYLNTKISQFPDATNLQAVQIKE